MTGLQRKVVDDVDATAQVWTRLVKRLGPGISVCSFPKRTLFRMMAVISAWIEDADDGATVLAYYGDLPFWQNELRSNTPASTTRSLLLAANPPPHITVELLSCNMSEPPSHEKECCIVILSRSISLVFCAHLKAGSNDVPEQFEAFWSCKPNVVIQTLDLLETAEDMLDSSAQVVLRHARQEQTPTVADADRLEALTRAFVHFAGESDSVLAQERQAFDERMRWHDDLITMIVHDLRTPLQSISLLLETFNNQPDLSDTPYGPMTAMALQSTLSMDRLIQTLLDLSRLQSGAFAVQWQPINLRLMMSEIVNPFMSLLEHSRLTLVLEFVNPPIPPWGDPALLLRVFHNLLDNAVRFTPPGGTITISSHISPDKTQAIISIKDTGRGISPDALPHIFERHFQSQRYNGRGAGMGLYFCKLAMSAQQGTIEATSTPGQGTMIVVTLQTHPLEEFLARHSS